MNPESESPTRPCFIIFLKKNQDIFYFIHDLTIKEDPKPEIDLDLQTQKEVMSEEHESEEDESQEQKEYEKSDSEASF